MGGSIAVQGSAVRFLKVSSACSGTGLHAVTAGRYRLGEKNKIMSEAHLKP